jgi:hypothetical protein
VIPAPGTLVTGEDVFESPEGAPPTDGDPQPVGAGGVTQPFR